MLTRLVQRDWFYWFAVVVFRTWARLFLGLEVRGAANVPASGGVVVAANHFSSLDPPIVGVSVPREIHFMAKRELFDRPASRLLMLGLRAFPVNRGGSDTSAIRTALRKLRSGLAVGIFIQGTRTKTGNPALDGAAFLTLRSGAALVPTAVWREGRRFIVTFGEPLALPEGDVTPGQVTAALTEAINALLPPGMLVGSAAREENG